MKTVLKKLRVFRMPPLLILILVLLWFGASKNGHPNYAPEWVKLHPEIYRLARGADGAHTQHKEVSAGRLREPAI